MSSGLFDSTDLVRLGIELELLLVILVLFFQVALKLLRNSLVFIPYTSYGIVERTGALVAAIPGSP